jgi:hypothetical protein
MTETILGLLAVLLTLALLSYLIADNPLYRIAVHLFIGLSAGYAVVLAWYTVIHPQVVAPLLGTLSPDTGFAPSLATLLWPVLPVLVGGVLLLLKTVRVARRAGGLVIALMVGVGAAVAVGGAITGTLIPQTSATFVSVLPAGTTSTAGAIEKVVEALFVVVGTLATLAFFYYGARSSAGGPVERPALLKPVAAVGQIFIGVAFGVMYAGALAASIAMFAERASALWSFVARP